MSKFVSRILLCWQNVDQKRWNIPKRNEIVGADGTFIGNQIIVIFFFCEEFCVREAYIDEINEKLQFLKKLDSFKNSCSR